MYNKLSRNELNKVFKVKKSVVGQHTVPPRDTLRRTYHFHGIPSPHKQLLKEQKLRNISKNKRVKAIKRQGNIKGPKYSVPFQTKGH